MSEQRYSIVPPARLGLGAILSIVFALGSVIASWGGRWGWGLAMGVLSVPLGLVGVVQTVSPRFRGAKLSIIAIGLGIIGIVFAIVTALLR